MEPLVYRYQVNTSSTSPFAGLDTERHHLADYYPFGMEMPGRRWRATGEDAARFGFNGKENDNEVKGEGNQQDYGFRIYDPRIARFLSVDPLETCFPSWSPYPFAMNRAIDGLDVDGLEYISSEKARISITLGYGGKNASLRTPVSAEHTSQSVFGEIRQAYYVEMKPGAFTVLETLQRDVYRLAHGERAISMPFLIPRNEAEDNEQLLKLKLEMSKKSFGTFKNNNNAPSVNGSNDVVSISNGKNGTTGSYGIEVLVAVIDEKSKYHAAMEMQVYIEQYRAAIKALTLVERAAESNMEGLSSYYRDNSQGKAILANYLLSGAIPTGEHWKQEDVNYLKKIGDKIFSKRDELLRNDQEVEKK